MSKLSLSVAFIVVLALGITLIEIPPHRKHGALQSSQSSEIKPISLSKYYRDNISFWERHLARDPYSGSAVKSIAAYKIVLARATGDEALYREAGELLERSSSFIPKGDPEAALLLARSKMARHRFSEAIALVDATLAVNANHRGLRETKADALQGLGEYDKALAEIEALVKEKPDFSYEVRRALLLDVVGRDEEGFTLLNQLESKYKVRDPEPLAWLRLMRGVYYLKRNELDKALPIFESSLAVAPDYYLAQEHIAEVYEKQGKSAQAKPFLEQAIATKRDPHLLLRLSVVERALGNGTRADDLRKESLEKFAANAGSDPVAHGRDYAEILLEENRDLDEALRLSTAEYEARPGDIKSNLVRARVLRMLGRKAEAKEFIAKANRYPNPDTDVTEEMVQIAG